MAQDFYGNEDPAIVFAKKMIDGRASAGAGREDIAGYEVVRCSLLGKAQVLARTDRRPNLDWDDPQAATTFSPRDLVVMANGKILIHDGESLRALSNDSPAIKTVVGPGHPITTDTGGQVEISVEQVAASGQGDIFVTARRDWPDGKPDSRIWHLQQVDGKWQAELAAGGGQTSLPLHANSAATTLNIDQKITIGPGNHGLLVFTEGDQTQHYLFELRRERFRHYKLVELVPSGDLRRTIGYWNYAVGWANIRHATQLGNGHIVFILNGYLATIWLQYPQGLIDVRTHTADIRPVGRPATEPSRHFPFPIKALVTTGNGDFILTGETISYLAPHDDAFAQHLEEQLRLAIPSSPFPYGRCRHHQGVGHICKPCLKNNRKVRGHAEAVVDHLKRIASRKIIWPQTTAKQASVSGNYLARLPEELRGEIEKMLPSIEPANWLRPMRARLAAEHIQSELHSSAITRRRHR